MSADTLSKQWDMSQSDFELCCVPWSVLRKETDRMFLKQSSAKAPCQVQEHIPGNLALRPQDCKFRANCTAS